MPELRKDPVVGRWVIIATERARRPGNFVSEEDKMGGEEPESCSLCRNKEKPVYLAVKDGNKAQADHWDVKVVEGNRPFLKIQKEFKRSSNGLYDVIDGYGVHEMIIETPEHIENMADLDVDQISLVFKTYAERMIELQKDINLQYAMAYKNFGWTAGSLARGHARSHLVAAPVNPIRIKEKLVGAQTYFASHKKCIYCDLVNQEKESQERVILETEHFIAITPFAARFLFEVWVLPKQHHCDFTKGIKGRENDLAGVLKILLQKFKIGLNDPSYNYVVQTAPFHKNRKTEKRWVTIEEDYHWHIELMPRLTRVAGFEKGTGFYICSIPPETTAEYLKGINI